MEVAEGPEGELVVEFAAPPSPPTAARGGAGPSD